MNIFLLAVKMYVKWIYLKLSWENFNCTHIISGLKFLNSIIDYQIAF